MKKKWAQYALYIAGIQLLVIGVVFMTKTNVGLAPYDGLVLNSSIILNISYGMVNILAGALFVLLQILILRRRFKLASLIQFAMVTYVSLNINFFLYVVFAAPFSENLTIRIVLFTVGVILTALGIGMFMAAGLYSFPLETLYGVLYDEFKIRIVVSKWAADAIFLALSYMASKVAGLSENSIGLGTIVLFIVTSPMINVYYNFFRNRLEMIPE